MSLRVAIYAPYSSDSQREASIEDQVRICRALAEKNGWTVAATYTDGAISGASLERPSYVSLVADAECDRFDIVVEEALHRISRDQEHVARAFTRRCGSRSSPGWKTKSQPYTSG